MKGTDKQCLNSCRNLEIELRQLRNERQRAFEIACGSTVNANNEKVQASAKNTTDEKFAIFASYSAEIDKKTTELLKYRYYLRSVINQINNSTYRTLLALRYIDCKTWEQIAEEMHYSEYWIRSGLHSQALKEVKIIKDMWDEKNGTI